MEENRLDDQPVFPGVTKTLSGVPLASSPLTSTFVPSVGEPPAIRHGEASPHADGGVSRNMVGANVEQGGIPTPRGGHPMPRCDGFADNGSPGSQEDGEAMRGGPHTSFHSVSVGSSAVSGGVGGGGEPGCDVVRKHSMLPPAPSGRLHTSTAAISAATVATSLAAATISSSSGALQSLSNSLDVAMERYVAATSKLPFRPGASYDEPTTDDAVMVEHSNTRSTVPLTLGELIQRQKDTIQRVSQPLPRHHHSLRGNEEEEEGSFVEKPSPVRPVDKYTENLQRKEGLSRPAARHLAGASHSSAEEDEMYLLMDADEEDGDDMEDVEWIIHKSHTRPQSSPPSRQVTEVTSEVDHRMDDSARDEEERVIANDQRSPHRPNRTSYPTSHSARVVGSSFSSSVALPVHPSTPNNRSFVAARTSTSTSSSVASPSTSRKFTAQTGHLPSRLETLRESFLLPFASSSRADALFTDHHNTDGA